ncbi:MAG: hypothetical protein IPH88_06340 [Bacteroidales bacterium]|nr:hypothetical protein [Bacteroidales bacterium]
MKLNYLTAFTSLVVLLLLTLLPLSETKAQTWYDANWLYRTPVSVANSGASTLTDYQVKISLPPTFDYSHANTDGSDLRLTLSDGTTEISF